MLTIHIRIWLYFHTSIYLYLLHKKHCKNLVNSPNYFIPRGKYCTRSNFSSIIVKIYTIDMIKSFKALNILFLKKRGSRVKKWKIWF